MLHTELARDWHRALRRAPRLTARQRQVVSGLAAGASEKELANQLRPLAAHPPRPREGSPPRLRRPQPRRAPGPLGRRHATPPRPPGSRVNGLTAAATASDISGRGLGGSGRSVHTGPRYVRDRALGCTRQRSAWPTGARELTGSSGAAEESLGLMSLRSPCFRTDTWKFTRRPVRSSVSFR